MTEPNKTELVASLADNKMQFQQAVSQLTNRLNNADWHAALDAIAELRKAEADLERGSSCSPKKAVLMNDHDITGMEPATKLARRRPRNRTSQNPASHQAQ